MKALNMRISVRLICLLLAIVSAFLMQGCHENGEGQDETREIVVAAASNLTDVFGEMGRAFTQKTGVRVTYSFGATADLAKQIENGAPFDVFAAADVKHVDELAEKNLLLAETRALYARGRLVLWIPEGSGAKVERLEDVSSLNRVAVAKPDVAPYGAAAVEALRALKVWEKVEPKVVYGQNVTQVKQFAASGNADAAFIPRSLVKTGEGQAIEVEESLHRPVDQAIAVVRASSRHGEARRFVEFVLSDEGRALLERYGYAKAEAGK